MSILQLLLLLIIVVVICIYIYLIYCGLYQTVVIERNKLSLLERSTPIIYKYIHGHYKLWHKAYNHLSEHFASYTIFGIFYDDPREVGYDNCRSVIGIIDNTSNKQLLEDTALEGYKRGSLPANECAVYVAFPTKNYISVVLGIRKIYPLIKTYLQVFKLDGHPFIEMYDSGNLVIATPLDNQDQFYVPEYHQNTKEKIE